MPLVYTNFFRVFIAAIASMLVGYVWYGPLFGKRWTKLVGMSQEDVDRAKQRGMAKDYLISFATSLITAYFLAVLVKLFGSGTIAGGFKVGIFAWVGFVATTHFVHFLFEKKPMELYKITVGHHLVEFLVMGAILATGG